MACNKTVPLNFVGCPLKVMAAFIAWGSPMSCRLGLRSGSWCLTGMGRGHSGAAVHWVGLPCWEDESCPAELPGYLDTMSSGWQPAWAPRNGLLYNSRKERKISSMNHPQFPKKLNLELLSVTGISFRNVNGTGKYANVTFSSIKTCHTDANIVTTSSLLFGLATLLKSQGWTWNALLPSAGTGTKERIRLSQQLTKFPVERSPRVLTNSSSGDEQSRMLRKSARLGCNLNDLLGRQRSMDMTSLFNKHLNSKYEF